MLGPISVITSRTTALPRKRLYRAALALPVFASLLLPIAGCRSSKNLIARLHPRRSKSRPNTTEYADTVAKVVSTPHLDILRWANFADYQPQVQQFYDGRNYELAWTRDGVPTPQASALIRLFTSAASKGLRPEDYDAQRWPELQQKLGSIQVRRDTSDDAQNTIAQFDAAVTIATNRVRSAGAGIGGWNRRRTSADCTFGTGRNAPGGRLSSRSTSADSRTRTLRTPYSFVDGFARRRSATSRCSINVASVSGILRS